MKPNYTASTLLLFALLFLGLGAFNWIVDPYQFYHRSYLTPIYVRNGRIQNPGIIKNFDYDTMILGSSHTMNFTPSNASRIMEGKAIRVALGRGIAKELSLTLEKALRVGKVKTVVLGLDYFAYKTGKDRMHWSYEFPRHLYEETAMTPLLYLGTWDTAVQSVKTLAQQGDTDYDNYATFHVKGGGFGLKSIKLSWRQSQGRRARSLVPTAEQLEGKKKKGKKKRKQGDVKPTVSKKCLGSIEANLVAQVRDNPEIRFILFLPPHSVLYYSSLYCRSPNTLEQYLHFKSVIVEQLAGFANCEIYDFQAAAEITHEFNNYCDIAHYSDDICNLMMGAFGSGEHRLTPENCQARIDKLREHVLAFMEEACADEDPFMQEFCPPPRPAAE